MKTNTKIVTTFGLLATLAAASLAPALADPNSQQNNKNNWRNLGIAGAVVAGYGLLNHNSTATLLGAAGAAYSANRYETDRRHQSQDSSNRRYYYRANGWRPTYGNDNSSYNNYNNGNGNNGQYQGSGYQTSYDGDGYNRNGYNRDGYNRDGYNQDGYNRDGYDRDGNDRRHNDDRSKSKHHDKNDRGHDKGRGHDNRNHDHGDRGHDDRNQGDDHGRN